MTERQQAALRTPSAAQAASPPAQTRLNRDSDLIRAHAKILAVTQREAQARRPRDAG